MKRRHFAAVLAMVGCMLAGRAALQAQKAITLTSQDYSELQQLYGRYNQAIDAGDGEAWAATFTPDGVFNTTNKGHDALVEFVKGWRAQRKAPRHWLMNVVYTPTAEGATARSYLILWDVSVRPPAVANSGVYQDVLVKTPQGWRFKS